jgi:hypothetical protein
VGCSTFMRQLLGRSADGYKVRARAASRGAEHGPGASQLADAPPPHTHAHSPHPPPPVRW